MLTAAALLLVEGCAPAVGPSPGTTGTSSTSSSRVPAPSPGNPSAEPTISNDPAPVATPPGAVRGVVVREGGRDPRSGGGSTSGAVPVGADPVSARSLTGSGKPTARTVTAADGSFQFNLPPGDYLIIEDISSASTEVTVTAEKTSTVTLTVPGA